MSDRKRCISEEGGGMQLMEVGANTEGIVGLSVLRLNSQTQNCFTVKFHVQVR